MFNALEDYCRKRSLKVSGKKAELVAPVFAASELDISVCLTAVQRTSNKKDEKPKRLKTPEGLLPNPLLLKDGWFGKTESMQSWPTSPGIHETIFRFRWICYARKLPSAYQRHTVICFAFLILIQHALLQVSIFSWVTDLDIKITVMSLRNMGGQDCMLSVSLNHPSF